MKSNKRHLPVVLKKICWLHFGLNAFCMVPVHYHSTNHKRQTWCVKTSIKRRGLWVFAEQNHTSYKIKVLTHIEFVDKELGKFIITKQTLYILIIVSLLYLAVQPYWTAWTLMTNCDEGKQRRNSYCEVRSYAEYRQKSFYAYENCPNRTRFKEQRCEGNNLYSTSPTLFSKDIYNFLNQLLIAYDGIKVWYDVWCLMLFYQDFYVINPKDSKEVDDWIERSA